NLFHLAFAQEAARRKFLAPLDDARSCLDVQSLQQRLKLVQILVERGGVFGTDKHANNNGGLLILSLFGWRLVFLQRPSVLVSGVWLDRVRQRPLRLRSSQCAQLLPALLPR